MKRKIWIVEDDDYLLELTRGVLERRGFDTQAFTNGQEALTALQQELPDLVIVDNILPDQSGLEICNAIKSSPETQHIPVLMTTGQVYWGEMENNTYDALNPNDYLIKPFEIDDLLDKVKKLLP